MDSKALAWLIRRHAIEMTHDSHGSHIGSVMSVADVVAVLYGGGANISPQNVHSDDRDRVVLSKGHAGAAIYAALAENGFFDKSLLKTYYKDGSKLSGHVSHNGVNGVEVSTGSLGHGVCIAAGMALGAKLDGKNYRVYAIIGDGECDEGSVWEDALFAAHFKLDNFVIIVDHNKIQSLTFCDETLKLSPFADKWKSFGFNVEEIDGHKHEEIKAALKKAETIKGKPTVIIANTVKGKGVSFMENSVLWHYRFPHDGDEYDGAVRELNDNKPDGVTDPYEVER